MQDYKLKKLPKNTYEILVTVAKEDIKKESESAFENLRNNLTVEGFRKGKVPAQIAKKHIAEKEIYEQIIKNLLPKIYSEIVSKENIKPIVQPQVDLLKAKENEDWQFKIIAAEKPLIDISKYKEIIEKIKIKENTPEIWVPGKDQKPQEKPKDEKSQQESLNKILEAFLSEIKIEIADMIVEGELNQRLTRLVDDVQKVGLTVDNYLKSKNTTIDEIKSKYRKEIEDMYKIEFLLIAIADKENITVGENDLEAVFKNIKDEKEKEQAKQNAYFYASIIRKQKTLEFLMAL